MIDLHSHLLPGVDDGARTVEQAVAVLAEFAGSGVRVVCLTPHLSVTQALHGIPPAHDAAFARLASAAPAGVRLERGVELLLDRPMTREVAALPGVRLGGSGAVLVEFSRIVSPAAAEAALRGVVAAGLRPVLAHPERYTAFSPEAVGRWRTIGALMQVDATTLLADSRRGDRARELVRGGLADLAAADNHGDGRSLAAAREYLLAHGGDAQAELLLDANPAAVLADRPTALVEPLPLREGLLLRLRRLRRQLTSEDA